MDESKSISSTTVVTSIDHQNNGRGSHCMAASVVNNLYMSLFDMAFCSYFQKPRPTVR